MTTNGGTQMPVPQSQSASCSCAHCGLMFDSSSSLQVHNMHYHHQQDSSQTRWGSSPSSTTPTNEGQTETNNNNQPLGKHHHIKAISPHQNTIAAADSSDNNPPTPQQSESEQQNFQNSNFTSSNNSQTNNSSSAVPSQTNNDIIGREMNSAAYPAYYEQYYHGIEYGHVPPPNSHPHHLSNGQHHQLEYKTVPSSRYLQQSPFNSSTHNNNNSQQSTNNTNNNPSVQISNNGLSPRVVSSSSPSNHTNSSSPSQIMHIPPGQPTPSPSPKQCDKCGVVCETDGQLIEHSQVAHSHDNGTVNGVKSENNDVQQNYPAFPSAPHHYPPHGVKDEPSSDILDLDSQKMVYPPHPDGSLPPMHSLHPLQSMQRHPMMWPHHESHFIPPHPGYHQGFKPDYHPPTPPIKNEYVNVSSHMKSSSEFSPILPIAPGSIKQEYNTIKADYNGPTGINQTGVLPPASSIGAKTYVTDIGENGAHLTSSPSDFPSTTTPQENGTFSRSFEPPTSSLPSSKGTSWKSNEARRPKTYNCTACNKWFTSSGHLKRHYNTTLHKNAVKSSGHPDPATLPISAHHHPNRDPNYVGKRRSHHRNQQNQQNQANQQNQHNQQSQQNNGQQNQQNQLQQQQTVVSEASARSPSDYQTPSFPLPSFGASALQQGFQQYGTANLHNSPGNGQAGPSVQIASQPRGLHQILMSNSDLSISTDNHQALQQQQQEVSQLLQPPQQQQQLQDISTHIINSTQQPIIMHLPPAINNINSMDQDFPLHINTNTPSFHTTIMLQPNYHNTTGNLRHIPDIQTHQQHLDLSPNSDDVDTLDEEQFTTILPSLHQQPHIPQQMAVSHMTSYDQMMSRFTGGGAIYTNELMEGPYSPDMPDQYHSAPTLVTTASYSNDDLLPQTASMITSAPSSPSVTSSSGQIQGAAMQTGKLSKSASVAATSEYRCDMCDKVFNKSCYLTQHNKTFHCGDKPFKCQRCGKRFPCEDSHEEHLAKHGGDKPFKCEQCPKAFNHKTDLRRHMCLHSGSKPFSCVQCGKGFIRKDHMVKHMDTHKKKLNGGGKKAKSGKKKLNAMPDSNDSISIQLSNGNM